MLDPELHPHLLYRIDGDKARFATWQLSEGHESLALFTSCEMAERYASEFESSLGWTAYEPPREKLIEILRGCRETGIVYAALDPLDGSAKTLFDLPQVLRAADGEK